MVSEDGDVVSVHVTCTPSNTPLQDYGECTVLLSLDGNCSAIALDVVKAVWEMLGLDEGCMSSNQHFS